MKQNDSKIIFEILIRVNLVLNSPNKFDEAYMMQVDIYFKLKIRVTMTKSTG